MTTTMIIYIVDVWGDFLSKINITIIDKDENTKRIDNELNELLDAIRTKNEESVLSYIYDPSTNDEIAICRAGILKRLYEAHVEAADPE